jgi:hypothetical protein
MIAPEVTLRIFIERTARMSTSDRFREIAREVAAFRKKLQGDDSLETGARLIKKASKGLQEWTEQVGEIPRMRLESELTPVLMKAHDTLDRARLTFEEVECTDQASMTWDLQQKIYRLLNDL